MDLESMFTFLTQHPVTEPALKLAKILTFQPTVRGTFQRYFALQGCTTAHPFACAVARTCLQVAGQRSIHTLRGVARHNHGRAGVKLRQAQKTKVKPRANPRHEVRALLFGQALEGAELRGRVLERDAEGVALCVNAVPHERRGRLGERLVS